jgi:hypothetical protein
MKRAQALARGRRVSLDRGLDLRTLHDHMTRDRMKNLAFSTNCILELWPCVPAALRNAGHAQTALMSLELIVARVTSGEQSCLRPALRLQEWAKQLVSFAHFGSWELLEARRVRLGGVGRGYRPDLYVAPGTGNDSSHAARREGPRARSRAMAQAAATGPQLPAIAEMD